MVENCFQSRENRTFIAIVICFCAFTGLAQISSETGVAISRKIYSDQLLDYKFNSFLKRSNDGHLWVSSADGWNRLSDLESRVFRLNSVKGLKGSVIQSNLFEDNFGSKWFSTYEYLVQYQSDIGKFFSFQFEFEEMLQSKEYHVFYYNTINEELWINVSGRIFIVSVQNPENFRSLPFQTTGRRFLVNKSASKKNAYKVYCFPWAEGPGLEVFDVVDGRWKRSSIFSNYDSYSKSEGVLNIKGVSKEDKLYIATNRGLRIVNSDSGQLLESGLVNDVQINDIAFLDGKRLLLSTRSEGLLVYDIQSNEYIDTLTIQNGLLSNSPFEIFVDKDESVYISFRNRGIQRLRIFHKALSLEFNDSIDEVHALNGCEILIEKRGERVLFDAMSNIHYSISDSGVAEDIKVVLKDSIGLWSIGMNEYCIKGTDPEMYSYCQSFSDGQLFDMTDGKFGQKYISASNATFELKLLENRLFLDSLELNSCEIESTNRAFWVSNDIMAFSLNENEVKICSYDTAYHFKLSGRLTDVVFDQDNNEVFLSTRKGLWKFTSFKQVERMFDLPWQLSECYISNIHIDENSILWMISDVGLFSCNLISQELSVHSLENIGNWNLIENAMFLSDKLILKNENLLHSIPLKELMEVRGSDVRFRLVDYNRGSDTVAYLCPLDSVISVPNGVKSIKLNLELASSSMNSKLFYFRENDDQGWIRLETNSLIISTATPGSDIVKFKVVGTKRTEVESYEFIIDVEPPYHQTWWFRSLAASALIGLGFGANSVNTRRKLREQERELEKQKLLREQREQMSRDLHDEMGGGLTKIKHIVEKGKYGHGDSSIQHIGDLASGLMGNMRDLLWSLDESNDEFGRLSARIRVAIAGFCKGTDLSYEVKVQKPLPMVSISGLIRRNILLILKEAFTNTLKHSNASNVIVYMEVKDQHLLISYKDDGSGEKFRAKAVDKQNGIINMKRRARQTGGSLTFQFEESGSEVILDIPI